jgi:hypothetical protein
MLIPFLSLLYYVAVGDVTDVSEVYAASIFGVEMCKANIYTGSYFEKHWFESGVLPHLSQYGKWTGKFMQSAILMATQCTKKNHQKFVHLT